jgi:hypothetical protein
MASHYKGKTRATKRKRAATTTPAGRWPIRVSGFATAKALLLWALIFHGCNISETDHRLITLMRSGRWAKGPLRRAEKCGATIGRY